MKTQKKVKMEIHNSIINYGKTNLNTAKARITVCVPPLLTKDQIFNIASVHLVSLSVESIPAFVSPLYNKDSCDRGCAIHTDKNSKIRIIFSGLQILMPQDSSPSTSVSKLISAYES